MLAVAPLGVGLLQLALSRTREGEADLEAAELTGDPHGLASALAKLRRREQMLLRGRLPTTAVLRVPSLFAITRQPRSAFKLCWRCRNPATPGSLATAI